MDHLQAVAALLAVEADPAAAVEPRADGLLRAGAGEAAPSSAAAVEAGREQAVEAAVAPRRLRGWS